MEDIKKIHAQHCGEQKTQIPLSSFAGASFSAASGASIRLAYSNEWRTSLPAAQWAPQPVAEAPQACDTRDELRSGKLQANHMTCFTKSMLLEASKLDNVRRWKALTSSFCALRV